MVTARAARTEQASRRSPVGGPSSGYRRSLARAATDGDDGLPRSPYKYCILSRGARTGEIITPSRPDSKHASHVAKLVRGARPFEPLPP